MNAHNQLRAFLENAQQQVAHTAITPVGYQDPTVYLKKTPAVAGTLNLMSSFLPALISKDGDITAPVFPLVTPGAELLTMNAGILQLSRVAAAGSHVITRPDPSRALAIGLTDQFPALEKIARYFNAISPAPFEAVADDAEVNASEFPVKRSLIDWSESLQKSVRFEIKRRYLKQYGNDLVIDELLMALALGLARAADEVLLTAINASTPNAFSIADVANQGLRVTELRALVGTNGVGASFRGDGVFTASNIPADTTGDMAGTLIGAFNRTAVAIHEDVTLTAERRNTQGDLVVTAHANLIPLIPDAAKFWAAA